VNNIALEQLLSAEEASRSKVYDDASGLPISAGSHVVGNPTVGIGRNLAGKGLSADEISFLFDNDVTELEAIFTAAFTWYATLDDVRQAVMVSLGFMGWGAFSQFTTFFKFMAFGQYDQAAADLGTTAYARQLPGRTAQLQGMLTSGAWPAGISVS
jgi:lysozyme